MKVRLNIYIILGIVFILLTWLFVGLFRDDEFYEPEIFTKYRPTFKVNFYSPIGQGDWQFKDLGPDQQLEEIAFQEFVIKQHQQNNSDAPYQYLPFILIQLTLTFLTLGFYKLRRTVFYKIWQLPAHFAINFILTSFGITWILWFDNIIYSIPFSLIIIGINYGTIVIMTGQKKVKPAI